MKSLNRCRISKTMRRSIDKKRNFLNSEVVKNKNLLNLWIIYLWIYEKQSYLRHKNGHIPLNKSTECYRLKKNPFLRYLN